MCTLNFVFIFTLKKKDTAMGHCCLLSQHASVSNPSYLVQASDQKRSVLFMKELITPSINKLKRKHPTKNNLTWFPPKPSDCK